MSELTNRSFDGDGGDGGDDGDDYGLYHMIEDDGIDGDWSGLPGWGRRKILRQPCLLSKRGARDSFIFIITIIIKARQLLAPPGALVVKMGY